MAQQTATEWLAEKWATQGTLHSSDLEQAKQMDKEHIMMAYNDGRTNAGLKLNKKSIEYYNETYNK